LTPVSAQTESSTVPPFASAGGGTSKPDCQDAELQRALAMSLKDNAEVNAKRKAAALALQQQLSDDLHIQSVIGDGACLFQAFSRSLHEQTGILRTHAELRQSCVQNIERTPALIDRFGCSDDASAYLNSMRLDTTYGDESCVHSLALLFSVQVHVYTPNYGIQVFYSEFSPIVNLASLWCNFGAPQMPQSPCFIKLSCEFQ